MKAVIQCGGKGTRLRPYTMVLPKPLMPVAAKPVLELLLHWLRRNNIRDIYITTGYLGHLIKAFCNGGEQFNLRIHYTQEKEPLGTIGPLSLLREELDETFLVINADCHRRQGNIVTVATSLRRTKTDFGVIEQTGGRITSFKEKPVLTNLVSMGVYCMEPETLSYIPTGVPFGFDDLILCLLAEGVRTGTFLHDGLWLDIGRLEDFQTAQSLAWDEQPPAFEEVAVVA